MSEIEQPVCPEVVALNSIELCLKAHGLLGCLLWEVNTIREELGLAHIDKEGYTIDEPAGSLPLPADGE